MESDKCLRNTSNSELVLREKASAKSFMLKLQCTHDNVDDTDILIMFIQNSDQNVLSGF